MSDEVSAALSKFLASKGLPSQISYILSASFGQLPTAYKFRVADADLKVSEVILVGAAHMLPEALAEAVSPLKGTIYLLSDVAIVLAKDLVAIYRQRGYLKLATAEIKPQVE